MNDSVWRGGSARGQENKSVKFFSSQRERKGGGKKERDIVQRDIEQTGLTTDLQQQAGKGETAGSYSGTTDLQHGRDQEDLSSQCQ